MSAVLAPQYLQWLLQGLLVTVVLSAVVIVASLPLGFGLCLARLSPHRGLRWPALAWLSLMRNTPLLVQLFFWYFGALTLLPEGLRTWLNQPHHLHLWLFGLRWPPFEYVATCVGLTLYSAAFFAEEFRAGVRGVPRGQVAAAAALGLRPAQRWRHVILPQAVRIALPPLAGQAMQVVKNSSLAMAVGVAELSYMARQVESQSFQAFQAFAVATLLYMAVIVLIEAAAAGARRQRRLVRV
ncbi:MAG: amino acid ABC transporter permease [Luteimonas sp.]